MGSTASDLGRGGRAPRAMRSRAGCCMTTLCCAAAGTIADTGAAAAGAVAPDTLLPMVTVRSVSTQALGIQDHESLLQHVLFVVRDCPQNAEGVLTYLQQPIT